MDKKPVVLVILDGWGEWNIKTGNAILQANLPTIKKLDQYYPKLRLQASGPAVGLPWGTRGNSEVGHQTIGAGQITFQYLPTINMAIENNSFYENKILIDAMKWAKEKKSRLHFLGLASDGSVHSHINHLSALLKMAKQQNVDDVFIHAFTDGRDTSPQSAKQFLNSITTNASELGVGKLASLCGRYYAMDRNNNWDRIEKAFLALTTGKGIREKDAIEALDKQYQKQITDEFLEPINLTDKQGNPIGLIQDNDSVIFFNYRKDRARQITKTFALDKFSEFDRTNRPNNLKFTTFAEYEPGLPVEVAFPPQEITTKVGEIISQSNKTQLRIAETEKFAHITYFFNAGASQPFPNEDRILIPSKKVKSYAEIPEMSANEVTKKLIQEISQKKHDFILVNYANPDMVGHTGDIKAGIKAVETVDKCLLKLIQAVLQQNGQLLVTADHGNVEEMINSNTFAKDTEHSTNPVPCWLVNSNNNRQEAIECAECMMSSKIEGMLSDIAPTILELLEIDKPREMSGMSLLKLFQEKI